MTTGDLSDSFRVSYQKKFQDRPKIKFDETVHAILIPARSEYDDVMKRSLWWSDDDYLTFRHSANAERNEDVM